MRTTVGQLLINDALPEDMRDHDRVLDKKGVKRLFQELADKHPDKYREVSHALSQVGWRAAQETGGFSFGLEHLRKSKAGKAVRKRIIKAIEPVLADENLTDDEREALITKYTGREMERQRKEIYDEALAAGNPLAMQVMSGSRGNPMNLASLLGSDLLYNDQRDRLIPVPITRSYAEGLRPEEYWAGTYGARRGVMATKFATRDAGFLAKQLNQVAHRLMIVDQDEDGEPDTLRGVPFEVDDPDSEGALLAHPVGGYDRNTPMTPKILHNLKRRGIKRILLRSPMVGGSPEGGVYARDVGIREKSGLPGRGENVGLAAAQALSEPLSQAQLSAKHSGGVAGEEKAVSGFDYINQLIQVPKTFKGGASHAQNDGIVTRVEEAPAGGQYVHISGEQHFVAEGFNMKVKRGDRVEAGDVLSDGIPNPAEIVKHKGVGEGRRYFTQAMRQVMGEMNLPANRRNIELLSRGLINHVRLTEEYGQYVPDDVVPYSTLENRWKPRAGAIARTPKEAIGQHLERPYLHYSIGTKVRPSMLKDFEEFGIKQVDVHDDPPPFQPEMIRGMSSVQHDPDWMTRMYGSGIKGSLLRGAQRGASSTELGTSFIPGLASGVDFGRQGMVRQPEPVEKIGASGGFGGWGSSAGGGNYSAPKMPSMPKAPTAPKTPPKPKPTTVFEGSGPDYMNYLQTAKPGTPLQAIPGWKPPAATSTIPGAGIAKYNPDTFLTPNWQKGMTPEGLLEMGTGPEGAGHFSEAYRPGMGTYGSHTQRQNMNAFFDPNTGKMSYKPRERDWGETLTEQAYKLPLMMAAPGSAGWIDPSLTGDSSGNRNTLLAGMGVSGAWGAARPGVSWLGRQIGKIPGFRGAGGLGPGYGSIAQSAGTTMQAGAKAAPVAARGYVHGSQAASNLGRGARLLEGVKNLPSRFAQALSSTAQGADEAKKLQQVAQSSANAAKGTGWGAKIMAAGQRGAQALRGSTVGTIAARGGGLLARAGGGVARFAPGANAALLALDAGKEMYQGYHKGREMGYTGLAAVGRGFHENSREMAASQLGDYDAEGNYRSYGSKAWDNAGRPIQSIYTASGEALGTVGEYGRLVGNKVQEHQMARAAKPGLEASSRRLAEQDPALKGWTKVWMGDRMGLKGPDGQTRGFDEVPPEIKEKWFGALRQVETQNRVAQEAKRNETKQKEQQSRYSEIYGDFKPTSKTGADRGIAKFAGGLTTTGAVPGSPHGSSFEDSIEGEGKGQGAAAQEPPKVEVPKLPAVSPGGATKAAPKAPPQATPKAAPKAPTYGGGYRPGMSLAGTPLYQPATRFAGQLGGPLAEAAVAFGGLDMNALGTLTQGKGGKNFAGMGKLFTGGPLGSLLKGMGGMMGGGGTPAAPAAAPAATPKITTPTTTSSTVGATPPTPVEIARSSTGWGPISSQASTMLEMGRGNRMRMKGLNETHPAYVQAAIAANKQLTGPAGTMSFMSPGSMPDWANYYEGSDQFMRDQMKGMPSMQSASLPSRGQFASQQEFEQALQPYTVDAPAEAGEGAVGRYNEAIRAGQSPSPQDVAAVNYAREQAERTDPEFSFYGGPEGREKATQLRENVNRANESYQNRSQLGVDMAEYLERQGAAGLEGNPEATKNVQQASRQATMRFASGMIDEKRMVDEITAAYTQNGVQPPDTSEFTPERIEQYRNQMLDYDKKEPTEMQQTFNRIGETMRTRSQEAEGILSRIEGEDFTPGFRKQWGQRIRGQVMQPEFSRQDAESQMMGAVGALGKKFGEKGQVGKMLRGHRGRQAWRSMIEEHRDQLGSLPQESFSVANQKVKSLAKQVSNGEISAEKAQEAMRQLMAQYQ